MKVFLCQASLHIEVVTPPLLPPPLNPHTVFLLISTVHILDEFHAIVSEKLWLINFALPVFLCMNPALEFRIQKTDVNVLL